MNSELAFFSVLIGVIGGAIFGLVFWAYSAQCTGQWDASFKPQFSMVTSCTIEIDGHRIPSSNYRVM